MAVKTLKIKRVFAYAIYNSLRNTPPKDYPTTAEIKNTIGEVLPAIKEHIVEYVNMQKRVIEISERVAGDEAALKAVQPQVDVINVEWRKYTKEHGHDIIDIKLDGDAFKTLKDQFNRQDWGTKWLVSIEEFGELLKSFEDAEK